MVSVEGDTRPHAVTPEGGPMAAWEATPKPGRAPKGYTPYTVVTRDEVLQRLKSRRAAKEAAEAVEAGSRRRRRRRWMRWSS